MNDRILGIALAFALGAAVGVWLSSRHYRPLMDATESGLASCTSARGNLEALTAEQGRELGRFTLAGDERQARAEQAIKAAAGQAQSDYATANRLQQERTGGDQCSAAVLIIDREFGL